MSKLNATVNVFLMWLLLCISLVFMNTQSSHAMVQFAFLCSNEHLVNPFSCLRVHLCSKLAFDLKDCKLFSHNMVEGELVFFPSVYRQKLPHPSMPCHCQVTCI